MKNKYILGIALVAIMVLSVVALVPAAMAVKPEDGSSGNGAPTGPHLYKLNLIGVKNVDHISSDTNNEGKRIFVLLSQPKNIKDVYDDSLVLDKTNRIYLMPGDPGEFDILDSDATDKGGAILTLPGDLAFEVWVRALGNPNANGNLQTCADVLEEVEPEVWEYVRYCQTPVVLDPSNGPGKRKFQDVTDELTTVTIGEDTYPIFGSILEDPFWAYDGNVKVVQIRFYPVSAEPSV